MTVAELKNELENYDDNMEVMYSYDYGDVNRTHVACEIRFIYESPVEYSEYHRLYKIADESEKEVILIS